ncbi:MAG: hypothetical protein ABSB19_08055 [Methylomonas sp.]|jgi:hypothetical protein
MLNIEIDNQELDENFIDPYGNNKQTITYTFADFVWQRKIKQDIDVLITLIDAGEALPLQEVM